MRWLASISGLQNLVSEARSNKITGLDIVVVHDKHLLPKLGIEDSWQKELFIDERRRLVRKHAHGLRIGMILTF